MRTRRCETRGLARRVCAAYLCLLCCKGRRHAVIDAAILAIRQAFLPPFRLVLLKSVGLSILLPVLIGVGLQAGFARLVVLDNTYLDWAAAIASALGVIVVLFFAMPPVISLVAGFFLDEFAGDVERTHY